MSSKLLSTDEFPQLQPAHALWKIYNPATALHRFRANSAREAVAWQKRTRQALRQLLTMRELLPAPLTARRIEAVDRGEFLREMILLRTSRHTLMPVYLLLPKHASRHPRPVVIAFHGHGYGVKDIVGLWEDGSERATPDGYHHDFAVELCRRGFVVAAPEISCFGERQTDFPPGTLAPGANAPTTCEHTAQLAFHLGGSAVALRVHDGLRLVDYLQTRRDLDARRIGAMGISGGGLHTFFSTCLDTRIRAAVISGYFCHWRNSIFAMSHCCCNFVPGLHAFGEIDDLVGLVAPRPLLVEAATHDPIFPMAGVKAAVRGANRVYAIWQAESHLETDYFEGRHQIHGEKAYPFLAQHLNL